MPNDQSEILTPAATQHHTPLKSITHRIPHLDPEALLLLGRDILLVHKVREQPNGPQPLYGQRLDLGWVVKGDVWIWLSPQAAAVTSSGPTCLKMDIYLSSLRAPTIFKSRRSLALKHSTSPLTTLHTTPSATQFLREPRRMTKWVFPSKTGFSWNSWTKIF